MIFSLMISMIMVIKKNNKFKIMIIILSQQSIISEFKVPVDIQPIYRSTVMKDIKVKDLILELVVHQPIKVSEYLKKEIVSNWEILLKSVHQ